MLRSLYVILNEEGIVPDIRVYLIFTERRALERLYIMHTSLSLLTVFLKDVISNMNGI